jgi:hypothetical protein
MPMRALTPRQQKIDRRRSGAAVFDLPGVPEYLSEMAALWMRFQIEQPDDVSGLKDGHDAS